MPLLPEPTSSSSLRRRWKQECDVEFNDVGTDGLLAFGNVGGGVLVDSVTGNFVGNNVISGNAGDGVHIFGGGGLKAFGDAFHQCSFSGAQIAPQLYAPNHQHFFNVRLDMDLDGVANSVYQIDVSADPPGPKNPFENAFSAKATLLGVTV